MSETNSLASNGGADDGASARRRPALGRRWIGAIAVLAVLAALVYLNRETGAPTARSGAGRSTAPPVRVAVAARRDMPVVERTIGTVLANTAVQVTARVQGVIVAAPFREGQVVKAGDLLFTIDPRPYKAALAQAQAQLAKDQAQLQNAINNEKRQRSVYDQHLTSSELFDAAIAATGSARAVVDADQAAIEIARLNLEYTEIRAPIDGKTGPILVQPGNMVTANGTAALVTLNQTQPIKVSFALPQSDLPRIQARAANEGLSVTVDQRSEGGGDYVAPVDFISNHVDESSGTIELRSTFPNEDGALVPGQLVDVEVELAMIPDATVVPREAVNTGPDGLYAYVVTPDDRAAQRDVRVLFDNGKEDAIEGDVHPGDRVIVDGQLRVVPGGAVFVDQPRAPKAESPSDSGKPAPARAPRS
jgi:multidrug efflux system membrane fusion protein